MSSPARFEAAPAVRDVRVRPIDLPVPRPTETAAGTMASAPVVLIDVRTEDGVVGSSYLRTYTPRALRSLASLVEDAGELVRGQPGDPATVRELLVREFGLLGTRGLVGGALAGLDMALWDASTKRSGRSLAAALGTSVDRVPAYVTLRSRQPEAACEEAAVAVSRGFKALKLKMAGDHLTLIRDVRAAVGPAVEIMVDYNQTLTVDQALRLGPALDELGVAWVEEPTHSSDLAGHARLAAAITTAVQLGENWESVAEVRAGIEARSCDLLMLDVMRIGGVSGWMEAAAVAKTHHLSSHAFPEFSVHLLAASPTRHWLEHLDYLEPILQQPLTVRNGFALVPDGPGAGLEWDEAAIARLSR